VSLYQVQGFHDQDGRDGHDEFAAAQSEIEFVGCVVMTKHLLENSLMEMGEDIPGVVQISRAKENPSDADQGESGGDAQVLMNRAIAVERREMADGLPEVFRPDGSHQVEAVQCPPDDIGPVGTMPEATDEKGDEEIELPAPGFSTVAAERNVEVVAEPSRERDVPAFPKFRDGF